MTSSTGSTTASPTRCACGRLSIAGSLARSTTLAIGDGTDLGGVRFERGRYVTANSRTSSPATTSGPSESSMRSESGCWTRRDASPRILRRHPACSVHGRPIQRTRACRGRPGRQHRAADAIATPSTAFAAASCARSSPSTSSTRASTFPRSTRSCCFGPPRARRSSCSSSGAVFGGRRVGKSVLTVLDFIGQAHADYRFDIRYRALIGGTRLRSRGPLSTAFPSCHPDARSGSTRSPRRSSSTTSRRRSAIAGARSSRTCAECRARRHWDRFSTRAHSTYSTFMLGQGLPRRSRR